MDRSIDALNCEWATSRRPTTIYNLLGYYQVRNGFRLTAVTDCADPRD